MRRRRTGILICASMLVVLGLALGAPSPAGAELTHKYIGSWPTGLAQPEVGGIDAQGRVYVYDQATDTIHRFDEEGNPAPFSALGTNVIDGEGGFNCPAVPTDCDRVPRGDLFGSNGFNQGAGEMAVDPRSSGPAAGYIYVVNSNLNPQPGDIEVFDPSGKFVGEIDRTVAFPQKCVGFCLMDNVSVASNGNVFQAYCCGSIVDQYAPFDADPKNHKFIGQLRTEGLGGWSYAAGGTPYTYALGNSEWGKYDLKAFLTQRGATPPIIAGRGSELWGDGGEFPNGSGQVFNSANVDPYTQDVYLHGRGANVEQWTKDNEQVGPIFGNTTPGASNVENIGFHPDGRLFMRGSENSGTAVAIFSDEVPIPDVFYDEAEAGHHEFTVNGRVELAGGPQVTDCIVQYGSGIDANGNPTYGNTAPCEPTPPYTDDTNVTATIGGLPTETTFHYRILATNANGTTLGANRTVRTSAVLGVKPLPATNIDRSSATINGTLNPDGMPTTYWFEYGIDTNYDSKTSEASAGSGSGPVAVSADLSQLQSGRVYHYRLVAKNALGTTRSEDATFQVAGPPAVFGLHATEVTETSAVIHARVNPRGYATTYYFEYGPTPSYGSKVPLTPEPVGDGNEGVPVSANLENLQPGIVYHYRVVAENQWGVVHSPNATFNFFPQSCPNEHVRQQTASNYLPDCRAYELVSPPNAGAVQLFPSGVTVVLGEGFGLAEEPNLAVSVQNTGRALAPSRFSFFGGIGAVDGTNPPNSLIDMYVSTRTTAGWKTTYPSLKGSEVLTAARQQCSIAMDQCIVRKGPDLLGTIGQAPENAPFLFDVDGTFKERWPTNVATVKEGTRLWGDGRASGDFTHYAFSSRDKAYAPGGMEEAPGSTYDNDIRARTVQIASLLPAGGHIPSDGGGPEEWMKIPAVSTDGSHILMSTKADDGPTDLYMRVDGAVSYDITRGTGATFIGMSDDGSNVFFASNHPLTPDDTDTSADIYLWEEEGDTLVRVSDGPGTAGNSDDCNADFAPQCDAQPLDPERGKTQFGEAGIDNYIASEAQAIYFFSPEQLDPENPGIANQRNLYLYRDGELKYVTTLDPGTTIDRMQISPDAAHAAFITEAQLTGYDNEGTRQMYTYDAATGTIECASCNPTGEPPTGDVLGSAGGPFMSDDGRAFFTSPDALVPTDTNEKHDVYEYVDGRPQLITSGTAAQDLYAGGAFYPPQLVGLEAVSADGIDVYFSTFDTLVPEDINGEFVKFYDARTNGGFPFNPGLQPCTAADECSGPPSRPPAEPLVSTSVQMDRGQVPSPRTARKKKRGRRAAKKRRKAKRARRLARKRRAQRRRAETRRGR